MTRTEDDLRTLLRLPLEPSDLLARVVAPRPSHRRRRARIALVTGLALVVVVGAVFAVLAVRPAQHASPDPAATLGPAPSHVSFAATVVSFADGSGYSAGDATLLPGYQSIAATRTGSDTTVGNVQVADADGAQPRLARRDLAPVDLPGGMTAQWIDPDISAPGFTIPFALRWRVASGLVVTATPSSPRASEDDVVALARAVRIGPALPVLVPFSSPVLPTGWAVNQLAVEPRQVDPDTGDVGRTVHLELQAPGTSQVAVTVDATDLPSGRTHAFDGTASIIAGRTWHLIARADVFTWAGPDWTVSVMATYGAGMHRTVSDAQLEAFISDLSLAPSFADESTWFDATSALPS